MACLGAVAGCDRTREETRSSGVDLRYLANCAPARVDAITVEALGNFATSDQSVVTFDPSQGAGVLRGLPAEAELYRLRIDTADFNGVAIARAADDGARFDALVLPLGSFCAAGSAPLGSLEGRAIAALEGGDVLIAGGLVGTGPSALQEVRRLRLARGASSVDAQGLFVPRAYAVGVRVNGESWLVGGVQTTTSGTPALSSFERYDASAGEIVALGRLQKARLRPGVVSLRDGDVLVVGGTSAVDGPALDSIERIPADGGDAVLLEGRLPWPASAPSLAVRDDGLVLVQAEVQGSTQLALLDPASGEAEVLDAPSHSFSAAPLVALPGARVAFVELDDAGVTTGSLVLLLPDLSFVRIEGRLTPFSGIREPRVSALSDGRILIVGERAGAPTARVVDPGRGEVRVQALDLRSSQLVARDDGSIAALGAGGVRVIREDARTPYDNPGGTLLADDADAVALDAASRWNRDGLALIAEADAARFELAGLRYADVTIVVEARGSAELLLRRADGEERAIALADERVGPVLCELAREPGDPVTLERSGDRVVVRTSLDDRGCRLEGFDGPLAIGLRALTKGTRIESLTVTRE